MFNLYTMYHLMHSIIIEKFYKTNVVIHYTTNDTTHENCILLQIPDELHNSDAIEFLRQLCVEVKMGDIDLSSSALIRDYSHLRDSSEYDAKHYMLKVPMHYFSTWMLTRDEQLTSVHTSH